jgi:hypothetical protein
MPRSKQSFSPAARTHLLCYLVASALASHALTKALRVDHIVESARIWLARNMMSASWLDRLMLGQMALKLSREHLTGVHAVRQSDVLTLFTNELTLNSRPTGRTHLAKVRRCVGGQLLPDRRIAAHEWTFKPEDSDR